MEQEQERQLELRDYLTVLRRRRWVVIEVFIAVLASVTIATYLQTPVYQATVALLVQSESPSYSRYSDMPLVSAALDNVQARSVQTHKRLIVSRPVIQATIEELKLGITPATFLKALNVETSRDTDVIEVHLCNPDPQLAADIANCLADNYVLQNQSLNREAAHGASVYLEAQLEQVSAELTQAETDLATFKRLHGIADLDEETRAMIDLLGKLEAQLAVAQAEARGAKARAEATRDKLSEQQRTVLASVTEAPNPVVESLETDLVRAEAQRASLLEQYAPTSQRVLAVDAQIEQLKVQLADHLQTIVSATQETINPVHEVLVERAANDDADAIAAQKRQTALQKAVHSVSAQLDTIPNRQKELAGLTRAATVSEIVYTQLLQKYHDVRVAESMRMSNARVVEPAEPPEIPVRPRKKLNIALAVVFGGLLGIMLAALVDYLDDSITDPEDVERYLGLPLLATIPKFSDREQPLIHQRTKRAREAEAYRILRSNIYFTAVDRPLGTILVTAVAATEGKTTTTANLGIAIAQEGKRVILVDTDLRRPTLHKLFNLDNTEGLTSVLLGGLPLEEALKPTEVENLSVLTSGPLPPNPAELLNSEKAASVLKELESLGDMVLLDSPPALMVADAPVLASKVDGVLLVVERGRPGRTVVSRGLETLRRARGQLIGIVLNKTATRGGYYYYYYYYDYGSEQTRQ